MSKLVLLLLIVSFSLPLSAQDINLLNTIEFNDAEDYKIYEREVLQCSDFLLTNNLNNEKWSQAMKFLFKWMMGTPYYSFSLDESIAKVAEKQESLIELYMACMTKYKLENKDKAENEEEVKINSFRMLIKYSKNPAYGIQPGEELKKLIDAEERGVLKQYLMNG